MPIHGTIREILLNHREKRSMITAPAIVITIGIKSESFGVDIRELITETIIMYHLPVASSSWGYYLLEDPKNLKQSQRSLDRRANKITMRKWFVAQYFNEFYNREQLEQVQDALYPEDVLGFL